MLQIFQERVLAVPPTQKLATKEDTLILEADQQRIILLGDFPVASAITGMIKAFPVIVLYFK